MTKEEFVTKGKGLLNQVTPEFNSTSQMSTRVKEESKSVYQNKLAELKSHKEKLEGLVREAEYTAEDKWEGVRSRLEYGFNDSVQKVPLILQALKQTYV
ncbi:hypothetical protein COT97_04355 [Candidatus Falkowbacteria bacterium CG10_big_fil_rev_8_21_14_0_10_39_11]|uniref:Uncharacterized protein n=1 Tax=Candidatus Falkowbacteria bacterium CG10_big_fil_rev_8_21_14_0_10_39_11 TaxID=1974565 RepID=A0A2H0V444_9BACT|nr:MAG: hypothetical protein COT97_04355 [Candidatus Falkowbacteria bacterium CG10_big_fil_rev_8_21_14_0_10_39_11]